MSDLPSFLVQTAPGRYTLTFSASFAETAMLCDAKVSWRYVTGIESASPRAGMNYGKAMHLALAHLYSARHTDAERISGDAEAQMRDWFERNPQPQLGSKGRPEWRTFARALAAFNAYRAAYPAEDFEVVGVEEPFEVVLGEFKVPAQCGELDLIDAKTLEGEAYQFAVPRTEPTIVTVRFRGIRDLRVRWHDAIWVLDHKTSTEWSDLTVDEGKCSFQFQGYAWVEQFLACQAQRERAKAAGITDEQACAILREPLKVGGVIGNYIISREPYTNPDRKPTPRDLPRDQFERVSYPYSDAQLDEWHSRALGIAQDIFRHWTSGDWPQRSTACAHWGRCEYYRLCWETDPDFRLAAALGADYRQRTPSPFEDAEGGKERL